MRFMSNPQIDFTDGVGRVQKDEWFDDIIACIGDLEIYDDDLIVYDFGKNANQKLFIFVDDDNDVCIRLDMIIDDILEHVNTWYVPREDDEVRYLLNDIWEVIAA